jgi:hypothetical protein
MKPGYWTLGPALLGVVACVFAQTPQSVPTGVVTGVATDPSGALIPGAVIHVETHPPSPFHPPDTISGATGNFTLTLPLGTYDITVIAKGFDPFVSTVTVPRAHTHLRLNAVLAIASDTQQVDVFANRNSTGADANKSALVLGAAELETFSDDDATFQQQLQALAGSDPGQPGSIYVDGFSGGQIPPKDSIREVRINQNPYSAQFQEEGFGRIEIFTKPGSDKLHLHLLAFANDNALNAQNPYSAAQPPYHLFILRGNIGGPFGKKTSYFANSTYNIQQNNSIINALATDTTDTPYSAVIPSPTTSIDETFRIDRQIAANNVFTGRYEIQRYTLTNGGLAGSVTPYNGGPPSPAASSQILPTEAFNSTNTSQTLQLSDSQNIGKNKILETRFQWIRSHQSQNPVSTAPTLNVEGYFNGGGSPSQTLHDHTDRTEFQEYFSLEHGKHFLVLGGRYRGIRDANLNRSGYNGAYTYSNTPNTTITALDNYNLGVNGIPSQFTVTTGTPSAVVYTGDLALYAEDEWRVRKDLTLNLGFRAESQSGIPDHFDPAPRVAASWAIGQTAKRPPIVTLRSGFGVFYHRFGSSDILTAVRRQTGALQQSYIFTLSGTTPTTCVITPTPSCGSTATATSPTLYNIDPHLRSEYYVLTGLTAERTFGKIGSISVNYLRSKGDDLWISRNINAPLPGTFIFGQPNSGIRPLGGTQNIYQFSSNGSSLANTVFANAQLHPTKNINIFLFTKERKASSDTGSASSFPTNQYDVAADYGRISSPAFSLFTGANIKLPYGFVVNPFVALLSRAPFNITTGADLNGDTIYNDRPSFATAASPAASVYKTPFGAFNANPLPGEKIIPINYGNGPRFTYTELGLRKTFGFGQLPPAKPTPPAKPGPDGKMPPPPPPPERPYQLNFAVEIDNIFNHTNPGPPVGILGTPEFGRSLSLNSNFIGSPNANRMIYFGVFFNF